MAILRYEERVRIERANRLREPDLCVEGCGCTPFSDEEYKGTTFHEVAATPLRMNTVCPHPKVVVPVTPAIVVEEPVKTITVKPKEGKYQFVDFNPCDGRVIGVVETVSDSHGSQPVVHSNTEITVEETVVDTVYDKPNKVKTVKHSLKENGDVEQPLKVGETTATDTETVDVDSGDGSDG